MKKFIAIALCLSAMLCLFGCGKSDDESPALGSDPIKVEMSVKDFGKITLELYPDVAPITVQNFVDLTKDSFYDGLTFHRVVKNFMIQGGDPDGNGTGGSKNTIKGEFASNGVENNLKHTRGVISMARATNPDSASSQFFIMHADKSGLDGNYAAFGKVTEGMDVVDKIANVEVTYGLSGEKSSPTSPVVIEYVKIIEE